ncbi:MAG: hypothetical protein SPG34_00945 [Trueperella sp.]|uniref:hypothetical protein n=1 Tax=Trueperella sp. TaxID=2699835 RepID=UPI002A911736|nr:hypothetical protein [Trueperella sp.]MDY5402893.1 hypothetical protein [Trueperella sp.]
MEELSLIQQAHQVINVAERQLEDAVAAARNAGASWADIGGTLGVSRQAALKRFGSATSPFTGETMTATPTQDLIPIAGTFLRHIADGDADAATTMIHPQVRKQLPWSAIAPIWEAVLAEYGAFERFEDSQVVGVKGTRQKTPIAQALHGKHIGTRSARPWPESRSTATVRWSGCCCRWRRPSIRSKDDPGSPGDGQNGSADICGTISAPSAHIRRRGRNRPANSRARTRPGRSGLPGARLDSGRVTETQRRLTITLPLALPADAAKATLSYIVI